MLLIEEFDVLRDDVEGYLELLEECEELLREKVVCVDLTVPLIGL